MATTVLPQLAYAGALARTGAHLIDSLIVYGMIAALQFGVFRPFGLTPDAQHASGLQWEGYILATVTTPVLLYFAGMESSAWRATIGKRLIGLRVVDRSSGRLPVAQALLRATIKFLPFEIGHLSLFLPTPVWNTPQEMRVGFWAVWVLLALYLLTIWWTPAKQSVYDRIAGTYVVHP